MGPPPKPGNSFSESPIRPPLSPLLPSNSVSPLPLPPSPPRPRPLLLIQTLTHPPRSVTRRRTKKSKKDKKEKKEKKSKKSKKESDSDRLKNSSIFCYQLIH